MVRVLRPAEVAERCDLSDESAGGQPAAERDLADDSDHVDWLMSADDDEDWDEDEDDDADDFDFDDDDEDDFDDEDE